MNLIYSLPDTKMFLKLCLNRFASLQTHVHIRQRTRTFQMQQMHVLWLLESGLAKSEQVSPLISIVPGLGTTEFRI